MSCRCAAFVVSHQLNLICIAVLMTEFVTNLVWKQSITSVGLTSSAELLWNTRYTAVELKQSITEPRTTSALSTLNTLTALKYCIGIGMFMADTTVHILYSIEILRLHWPVNDRYDSWIGINQSCSAVALAPHYRHSTKNYFNPPIVNWG